MRIAFKNLSSTADTGCEQLVYEVMPDGCLGAPLNPNDLIGQRIVCIIGWDDYLILTLEDVSSKMA